MMLKRISVFLLVQLGAMWTVFFAIVLLPIAIWDGCKNLRTANDANFVSSLLDYHEHTGQQIIKLCNLILGEHHV